MQRQVVKYPIFSPPGVSFIPTNFASSNFCFSEPVTEVLGGPDMHVDRGSTINLTCVSRFSPKPPPDVIWYHNDKVKVYLRLIKLSLKCS